MPTLSQIRQVLTSYQPEILKAKARRAAVALILRGSNTNLEMLMIRRAEHADDPWSGDLGFPGGKVDLGDISARAAAERETDEEVGLKLSRESFLGQLDDIAGAYLPVNVACFVYHLNAPINLSLNHEVSKCWWIPLSRFLEADRHRKVAFIYRNQQQARPVIDLIGSEQPFLWGITYRLIKQFFNLISHPLPASENSKKS